MWRPRSTGRPNRPESRKAKKEQGLSRHQDQLRSHNKRQGHNRVSLKGRMNNNNSRSLCRCRLSSLQDNNHRMVHDNQPVNKRQLCHQHLKNKLLNNHQGLLHNKQIGLLSNRQGQLLSNRQDQLLSNQPDRVLSQLPNLHNGLSNKSKKQSNLPDKLLHHNRNHNRPQKNLVSSLLNGHLLSNQLNVSNLVGSSQVNPALKLKLLFRPMEQVRLQF